MSENEKAIKVEYRNWLHGQPPKRTKLEIGGWAGENNWKTPQPWHCKPYADASTYGLELIYTWQATATVTCDEKGMCKCEADWSKEIPEYLGKKWVPMACFAPWHFGYVAMVDIKTPTDHNLLVQPHPKVFSCRDGSTPVAVPGMLEMDWWPEIFFIVFKAPMPGCKYVFKHGDPIATFLIVPRNIQYDISPMSKEVEELRANRQHNLEENWKRLCTRVFYTEDPNEFFDNKYKVLSNIAKREGYDKVGEIMDDPKKVAHYYENPQIIENRPEDKRTEHHCPWSEKELEKNKKKKEKQLAKEKEALAKEADEMRASSDFDYTEPLGEVDALIEKTQDFNAMSEEEFERLIATFKRQRRKLRQERSLKLKNKAVALPAENVDKDKVDNMFKADDKPIDPKKIVAVTQVPKKKPKSDEEWVLGHRIEKIKK